MRDFLIPEKIVWRSNLCDAWFYPSVQKDIEKRGVLYQEHFSAEILKLSRENVEQIFFPLYLEEIVKKEYYYLNKQDVLNRVISRIENPENYIETSILTVTDNETKKVVGCTLFNIRKNSSLLFVAERAFKRNYKKELFQKATLSFWGEYNLKKYCLEKNIATISYGKDKHPYESRERIGLSLYKLKRGGKPKAPKNTPEKPVQWIGIDELDIIKKNELMVFFSEQNTEGYFQRLNLFYPKNSLEFSFVREFAKVTDWAGLEFVPKEF